MTAENSAGAAPEVVRSGQYRDWRGSAWIASFSIALVATSLWLSATSVGYLVVAPTATAAALVLGIGLSRGERGWSTIAGLTAAAAILVGATAAIGLGRIERGWAAESARLRVESIDHLAGEVERANRELTELAEAGLSVSEDRSSAFVELRRAAGAERDLVLYRGDSVYAWAGRPKLRLSGLSEGAGVAGSPFYLVLYSVASGSGRRAVASRALYATPPADRGMRTVAGDLAASEGITGFRFVPTADSATLPGARVVRVGDRALFAVDAVLPSVGEVKLRLLERARERAGLLLAVALSCFVVAGWRMRRSLRWRSGVVGVGILTAALAPLSAFSNSSQFFDPAIYFTPLGGPLTANAAALGITSALVLLSLLSVVRRQSRLVDRRLAVAIVLVAAGAGPFLLRDLARGIQIPANGVTTALWLTWELPLFLAAAAVMLTGAAAGSAALGRSRGLPALVSPALAVIAAVLAPVVWGAPGQWPWWYPIVWILSIGALAAPRRTTAMIVSAATVAALGATTLVWGATMRARVRLAEQDIASLGAGDAEAPALARRLGDRLAGQPLPDRHVLLERFATSELAAAGFPVWLASWKDYAAPAATLATAPLSIPLEALKTVVMGARLSGQLIEGSVPASPAVLHVVATPVQGGVVTVVVAPRTKLIPPEPFARLLGVDAPTEGMVPYTAQLTPVSASAQPVAPSRSVWRREGNELHGDWVSVTGSGKARAHIEVGLRSLEALMQRGALIVLLNLAIVALLWLTSVLADGAAARWLGSQRRRWARSYRTRLSLALFAFFVVPAMAFAVWSYQQLSDDAASARELLVRETLRSVAPTAPGEAWLDRESRRLGSPLFLYVGGELASSSDSLLDELAPTGRLLDPAIAQAMLVHGEVNAHAIERVGSATMLFGYRAMELPRSLNAVVAAPARSDDAALDERARDLGILVLFTTAVGALAALWLSGIAARQLARPIGSLRSAALAFAGGQAEPHLEDQPTTEFVPVFAAFRRMMSDLSASRAELEEAQRRTATVLRNAASGVIAVDDDGVVTLANPRADELIGTTLVHGTRLADAAPPELAVLVNRFLAESVDDADFEMRHKEQQWRGRLTRLMRGGAVVTLDDVSEIARAERVLAWGEMARQVAHEIKNPLTPIRLGVQHLQRARADTRVDFDRVLEQNVERILKEIDRLDEIARAFSRYGQGPEQRAEAEPVDVASVLRELVELETMGDETVQWSLEGASRVAIVTARRQELREVLLNVLENARLAKATEVRCVVQRAGAGVSITVKDNGHGIAPDVLPRIFEPHFSTRTSGSGLGLAVSRRLIEGWGGTIGIASNDGKGTIVAIALPAPRQ